MVRPRCPQCLRPESVCYCHTISTIDNHWPIAILQHKQEINHAIGTARIAQLSLSRCCTVTSGSPEAEQLLLDCTAQQVCLVYPGENSRPLINARAEWASDKVRPLLFIDGTWRKTKRMLYESPLLAALPRVSLNPQQLSRYRIRKSPNHSALSTIEAIVLSLSTLENNPSKYQPLLTSLEWIIDQQVKAMGNDVFNRNYPSQ